MNQQCNNLDCKNEATTAYHKKPVCYVCWKLLRKKRSQTLKLVHSINREKQGIFSDTIVRRFNDGRK